MQHCVIRRGASAHRTRASHYTGIRRRYTSGSGGDLVAYCNTCSCCTADCWAHSDCYTRNCYAINCYTNSNCNIRAYYATNCSTNANPHSVG